MKGKFEGDKEIQEEIKGSVEEMRKLIIDDWNKNHKLT
jgi:hypothetical protein